MKTSDHDRLSKCRNCETPLQGTFCHVCGQENRDLDVSARELISEWLGNLFSFDARIWRTLRFLILKPGLLSEEYRDGRRARYVPPLRLCFFISLIMFLVSSWLGLNPVRYSDEGRQNTGAIQVYRTGPSAAPTDASEDESAAESPQTAAESAEGNTAAEQDADDEEGGFWHLMQTRVADDPAGFNQIFLREFPKVLFLLVPVFALFLRILFRRSERRYLYHLVFSLHLHSFAFLATSIGVLLDAALGLRDEGPGQWTTIIVLFYLFFALRRFYDQKKRWIILKMTVLFVAYFSAVLVSIFLLIAVLLYTT